SWRTSRLSLTREVRERDDGFGAAHGLPRRDERHQHVVDQLQLEHTWSRGVDGAHYVSVLDIGARSPFLRPVNWEAARRFPDHMVEAWVKHNVEEVGQLEYLLPALTEVELATPDGR